MQPSQDAPEMMMDRVVHQDCVQGLLDLPAGTANLIFADPPFNIGYEYDVYDDRKDKEKYLAWSSDWITAVKRALAPNGAFWLAIGDEYAAELKLIAQDVGFHCRSWVIWYYTFGVNCRLKFTRSHAHLFHFVANPNGFVFNDKSIRVPSARQLVYNDRRANSAGRLPDDTWILRPQDLVDGFTPDEDLWYFPRVAGTFKERAGFHGCQMPEQLLGRVIKSSSNLGDTVIDPFSGSGTTLAVAKKLGRRFLGFELSEDYVKLGNRRIADVRVGDRLNGSPEPLVCTPATASQKKKSKKNNSPQRMLWDLTPELTSMVADAETLVMSFQEAQRGFSVDRVVADPLLNEDFQLRCDRNQVPGTPAERNRLLFAIRHRGLLRSTGIELSERTFLSGDASLFLFASEIAWRQISDKYNVSLDELLCDPRIASEFDQIAARFAPGFEALDYRWAALKFRNLSAKAKVWSQDGVVPQTTPDLQQMDRTALGDATPELLTDLPNSPGIYSIHTKSDECLYVGESPFLADHLRLQLGPQSRDAWRRVAGCSELLLRYAHVDTISDYPYARQCFAVKRMQPRLNVMGVDGIE